MTIPLNKVNVDAKIVDGVAKVIVTYEFQNRNNFSVNPVNFFCLDCNATIHNVTMQIENRLLNSVVKEKTIAKNEFVRATKNGQKANLIEKISHNEYRLHLSCVNAGENVNIFVEYVTTLECDATGSYRFVFPTNIGIKYFSPVTNPTDKNYANVISEMTYTDNVQYNYTFYVEWMSANKILELNAPEELCEIELSDNIVKIISNKNQSQGDFTIGLKTSHVPCVYYYEDTQNVYTLTTIKVSAPTEIDVNRLKKEYIVVVDCSGSMSDIFGSNNQSKMEATNDALTMFLTLLNPEDYFNIIFFGSTYHPMFTSSKKATKIEIENAIKLIEHNTANLGGTELYNCMNDAITEFTNFDERLEKIIIVFTDGQIGNYTKLTSMIKTYYDFCCKFAQMMSENYSDIDTSSNRFRIFTIGIGNDVDRKLIKVMADITGGLYVCARDSTHMKQILEYIVFHIGSKYYLNARLESNENVNSYCAMYPNRNYIFVESFDKSKMKNIEENGLSILCTNPKNSAPIKCTIKFNKFVRLGIELKQLYDNVLIKNMEHRLEFEETSYSEYNQIKNTLINLSIESHIMSKYTSFLIIDDKKTTFGPSVDMIIPHYACNHGVMCENDERLEGGMDMFGGNSSKTYHTGDINFVPYNTTIKHIDLIHSLNNIDSNGLLPLDHNMCCYKSFDDMFSCANTIGVQPIIYFNIIIYFELAKHSDLSAYCHQILHSICLMVNKKITSFTMLKARSMHEEYIQCLIGENLRRTYRVHTSNSYWGDY